MEATAVVATARLCISHLPSKRSLATIGRLSFPAFGTGGYSQRTGYRAAVPFCTASRVGMEESSGFSSQVALVFNG